MNVEEIKTSSHGLRGTLAETLADPEKEGFSQDDQNLIKFHGFYQQRNRDKSLPESAKKTTFMVRGRIPGGRLDASQYLKWDELADSFGGQVLRLTTRQTIQLHGVVKNDLRPLMQGIYAINQSTIGACGDVVRNVTQVVNPRGLPSLAKLDEPAILLSDHFKFKSSAWTELWIDEERVNVPGDEDEPFYGATYLPRKFKIGITAVGDNGIDIYTNDLGFAAEISEGGISGYFVFAGGGMGMTHGKAETYPRLADLVGYIPAEKILETAIAIVSVHRDFGDRTNRKHARLKYVIQEQGLEWFRTEVEKRQNFSFTHKPLPPWNTPGYLGWQERLDGTWSLGVHILCGRIRDNEKGELKTALREIVRRYSPSIQLTPDQDLILQGIRTSDKEAVEALLVASGYSWKSQSPLYDRSMACVSLPTCSLALTDAEQVLPEILESIDTKLETHGLKNRPLIVRVTGCPNGCARPYSAEIGLVGQSINKYALFLGGTAAGDRIASLFAQRIPLDKIGETLEKLFIVWKNESMPGELFGDFFQRIGSKTFAAKVAQITQTTNPN